MKFDMKAFGDKAKGYLKTAGEKAVEAAKEVRERTDRAAEVVAAKVTEVTGRETTASEVKKAAVIAAGVVAVGTVAIAAASAGADPTSIASGGTLACGGADTSAAAWGTDFESQATRLFAENGGSLNFYTPHVDSCGTVYSGPNG